MRTVVALLISLASLACAPSSTERPPDDAEPPTNPTEVEGPAPTPESAAVEEGLCALGPIAEWSACDGQRVRMRGRVAEHVMQHPIVATPEEVAPDGRNTHQGYMDAEGVQLIVVTAVPIACADAMSVVGTLRGISLGDGSGRSKESYGGWSLVDAEVTCE
jgi:hypothetical protein